VRLKGQSRRSTPARIPCHGFRNPRSGILGPLGARSPLPGGSRGGVGGSQDALPCALACVLPAPCLCPFVRSLRCVTCGVVPVASSGPPGPPRCATPPALKALNGTTCTPRALKYGDSTLTKAGFPAPPVHPRAWQQHTPGPGRGALAGPQDGNLHRPRVCARCTPGVPAVHPGHRGVHPGHGSSAPRAWQGTATAHRQQCTPVTRRCTPGHRRGAPGHGSSAPQGIFGGHPGHTTLTRGHDRGWHPFEQSREGANTDQTTSNTTQATSNATHRASLSPRLFSVSDAGLLSACLGCGACSTLTCHKTQPGSLFNEQRDANLSASWSVSPHCHPACLPAPVPACPTACLPHCLPACLPHRLPACLPQCLPAPLPACLTCPSAYLLACQSA